jgi:predicted MFS family arabinose efflux permease
MVWAGGAPHRRRPEPSTGWGGRFLSDDGSEKRSLRFGGLGFRLFAALIAGESGRLFLIGTAPLLLTAFVDDRGLGEARASLLSSAELLASAVVAIAISDWLTWRSRAATARVGLVCVVVAQLLSLAQVPFLPLLALRALAGLGAGLAGAAAIAAAAGTPNPERVFASISFVTALLGICLIGPIGMAVGRFGVAGALVFSVVLTLVVFPLLGRLPRPAPSEASAQRRPTGNHTVLGVATLVALFAFMLGQNAVWTFAARIGQSKGLSIEAISWIFAATAAAGLAGAASSAVLGLRRGRLAPLLFSIAGIVGSIVLLVEAGGTVAFVAGYATWSFLFAFSMPYFLGLLAALDRHGRWAAMGTGVSGIGAACGPAAVGASVEANGYGVLATLIVATGLVAATTLVPVVRSLRREPISGS